MMSKKDYELFANEIYNLPKGESVHFDDVMLLIGRIFSKDNPRFQQDKFERACYEGKHIRKAIKTSV